MMIKKLLFVVICLLLSVSVHADCVGNLLTVFPEGNTIKQNSIIMLEGYGTSQSVIKDLDKKYPVYLSAGKSKVGLMVKEICVGQFDVSQAILVPKSKLIPGVEYTLVIDNLPENEFLNRFNVKTGKNEKIKYKVTADTDTDKPVLYQAIKELKKDYAMYGCGPARQVVFNMPVKDKSEVLIKTTILNVKTSQSTTYYLTPEENKIKVGHGMCGGAFTFDNGKYYRASFAFMDASGNITEVKGPPVKFIWLEGS